MARQALSDKSVRRYARRADLPIIRMLARGGSHWILFVTADHRHGSLHAYTLAVEWEDEYDDQHWSSCRELFPDWLEPRSTL